MSSFLEPIEDFRKELLCSICGNFFADPVSIECGHNFCYCCLFTNCQEASTFFSCPECERVSQLRDFKANRRLGKLAAIAKKLGPHHSQDLEDHSQDLEDRSQDLEDRSQDFEDRGKCEVHQNVKMLFCEDDQRPICVSCSQTLEHEAHTFCCMDEAAENFREKLQETMIDLREKTKNVVLQMTHEKINFIIFKNQRQSQKNSILFEFQKMQQLFKEEKDFYLSCVETWATVNSESLSNRISELSHHHQALKKRITELEEERQKPALDLLRDMKGILSRNQCVLQKNMEAFTIYMTIPPILEMMEWISKWKVDITLDCNTADPGLIISEDLKSVWYGGIQGEVLNSYERTKDFAKVLGSPAFISGRYYWEVKVPEITKWCVGIYQKSKDCHNFFVISSTQIQNNPCLYVMAQHHLYSHVHLKYRQISPANLKVGIFLDYERGEMSFYDAIYGCLIYTFPPTSFSGPFLPLFCLPKEESCLSICP
ncbi:probable E3 ubiquitin-protein ligase TRIML1 [Antechinus flavipes]|uniref:probable E3 ubiquitin-protein ligase TRIML1 n=1 Tax=Antechinus flavipes TaxID=38775 RepID=UPI0022356945|nr:probable E3 ubiquitin-protein ligase TRIML1 [Antechinus flavipes]